MPQIASQKVKTTFNDKFPGVTLEHLLYHKHLKKYHLKTDIWCLKIEGHKIKHLEI